MSASSQTIAPELIESRNRAIAEFIATERTLAANCSALAIAVREFLNTNSAAPNFGLATEADAAAMFHLTDVLDKVTTGLAIWENVLNGKETNLEILVSIRRAMEHSDRHLLTYLAATGLFGVFVGMYSDVFKNNPKLTEHADAPLASAGGALSVLINPVQRIPRFGLLFKAVIEDIKSPDLRDRAIQQDAATSILRKFGRIGEKVNSYNTFASLMQNTETLVKATDDLFRQFCADAEEAIQRTVVDQTILPTDIESAFDVFRRQEENAQRIINNAADSIRLDRMASIDQPAGASTSSRHEQSLPFPSDLLPTSSSSQPVSTSSTSQPVSTSSTSSTSQPVSASSTSSTSQPVSASSTSQPGRASTGNQASTVKATRRYSASLAAGCEVLNGTYQLGLFGGTQYNGRKVPAHMAEMLAVVEANTTNLNLNKLQALAGISVRARFSWSWFSSRDRVTQRAYDNMLNTLNIDAVASAGLIRNAITEHWRGRNSSPTATAMIARLNRIIGDATSDDIAAVIHIAQEAATSWKRHIRPEQDQRFYENITDHLAFAEPAQQPGM